MFINVSGGEAYASYADPLLSYASIVLGFSVATSLFAVAMPDRHFATFLTDLTVPDGEGERKAEPRRKDDKQRCPRKIEGAERQAAKSVGKNGLAELMFVFVWTAVVHLGLVSWVLGGYVTYGASLRVERYNAVGVVGLWVSVLLAVYGLLTFLVAIVTLFQAGHMYSRWIGRQASDGHSGLYPE